MSNEPSWEDIFNTPPRENPATPPAPDGGPPAASPPAAGPPATETPAAPVEGAPTTRREMREAEARQAAGGRNSDRADRAERPEKKARAAKQKLPGSRSPGRETRIPGRYDGPVPPRRRRRLGWLWALLAVLVVGGAAAWGAWTLYEPQIRHALGWELPIDYTGNGNGKKVTVVIKAGDIGSDIAKTLHSAGVTLTAKAFYDLLLKSDPAPTFLPGTYSLEKEMSAKSALSALSDPKNKIVSKVVIPEGTTLHRVLERLADGTGVAIDDLQTAADDFTSYGIPATAPSLEGYLFPATYSFDPGLSAHDLLQTMVDRMFDSLDAAGVEPDDRHRVVTLASIIQKEGGSTDDFYKVSRVFTNRINQGMLLQSDATVSYGSGNASIATTAAERADAANLYNTYVHPGLPVGPICAPGDDAIDAALNPADGTWLYFVLINGETGETTFSNTLAEHNAAVKVWQKWLKEHPDWDQ